MTQKTDRVKIGVIATFYIIAVAVRYATNKTQLLQHIPSDFLKVVLQGAGPALAALIVFPLFRMKPTQTLWGNFHQKIVPVLIFWGLPVLTAGLFTWVYKGAFSMVTFSIIIYALLEEMGWRGFLQPALSSLPKFANIFLVAVLWFIWHLDFEWSVSNLSFFFILLFSSWGLHAVANKTHSLIALSAFHAIYDIYAAANNKSATLTAALAVIFVTWIGYLMYRDKVGKGIILTNDKGHSSMSSVVL